jgi:hypothetical protein
MPAPTLYHIESSPVCALNFPDCIFQSVSALNTIPLYPTYIGSYHPEASVRDKRGIMSSTCSSPRTPCPSRFSTPSPHTPQTAATTPTSYDGSSPKPVYMSPCLSAQLTYMESPSPSNALLSPSLLSHQIQSQIYIPPDPATESYNTAYQDSEASAFQNYQPYFDLDLYEYDQAFDDWWYGTTSTYGGFRPMNPSGNSYDLGKEDSNSLTGAGYSGYPPASAFYGPAPTSIPISPSPSLYSSSSVSSSDSSDVLENKSPLSSFSSAMMTSKYNSTPLKFEEYDTPEGKHMEYLAIYLH